MKPFPFPSVTVVSLKFGVRVTFKEFAGTPLNTTMGVSIRVDGSPFVNGRSSVSAQEANSSPF